MFISDIHGIKTNIDDIKNKLNKQKCDKLIVLGDLYYHGVNHNISECDNEYILNFFNSFKNKLICMRGNCDTLVDIKISNFPILNDLGMIYLDGIDIYITHGNHYNMRDNRCFKDLKGVLVYGHEHVPYIYKENDMIYINTGSISLPRGKEKPSYVIYEDKTFTIYDIEDKVIDQIILK